MEAVCRRRSNGRRAVGSRPKPPKLNGMNELVLIAEDDRDIAEILDGYFKREAFRTVWAADGVTALELHAALKPDVVILDVTMPRLDGWSVLRELRSRGATPVIMVTALSLAEERIRGIEAGATDLITKPFNKKELLARIQSSLVLAKIGMNGIIHQLPGAVVITDPAWQVIGMSPLATILLGIPEPGLRVFNFAELLEPAEKERVASDKLPAEFSLRAPATHSVLEARQTEVIAPAGQLVLRVITLMAAL